MRTMLCRVLALAGALALASRSGRAAAQWSAPPAAVPGGARPPRTVDEADELRLDLLWALRSAEEDERHVDAAWARRDLYRLDRWYELETRRRSDGALAGGIVMISSGGVAMSLGLVSLGLNDLANGDEGLAFMGWGGLLTGAALVGGGIALTVHGGGRVVRFGREAQGPRTTLRAGASGLALDGAF